MCLNVASRFPRCLRFVGTDVLKGCVTHRKSKHSWSWPSVLKRRLSNSGMKKKKKIRGAGSQISVRVGVSVCMSKCVLAGAPGVP